MLKMKKAILLGFVLLIAGLANAQIIDHYGLRVGAGLSNQHWENKEIECSVGGNVGGWKRNKTGFGIFLNAEKELTYWLSVRPEIGYLQKGFKDDNIENLAVMEEMTIINSNVILHDLSANIGLKISPTDFIVKPYLIAGLRGDYMMSYKGPVYEFKGEIRGNYKIIDDFNKFTFSGLIGLGFEYQELLYLDLEFNPAITKNLDGSHYSVKNRYYGLTIGLNINQLTKKEDK